jgi:hypothetical protein
MKRFIPILFLAFACGTDDPPADHAQSPPAGDSATSPDTTTEGAWAYETLTREERAVVDRGRDVAGWDRVHRGFADAVRENASKPESSERTGR